jgi:hypothetical protein
MILGYDFGSQAIPSTPSYVYCSFIYSKKIKFNTQNTNALRSDIILKELRFTGAIRWVLTILVASCAQIRIKGIATAASGIAKPHTSI